MSESSSSSVRDRDDVDDADATLLYDVLVYHEWPSTSASAPEPQANAENGDPIPAAAGGWKDKLSSWVKWSSKFFFHIKRPIYTNHNFLLIQCRTKKIDLIIICL
jgi:hypothetical protein